MARSVDRPTASDGTARRIPIVIGVSGPQGLADADRAPFEDAVRTILAQLRQLHPDSPFLVLSPLAEGAERLMARVGLAYGAALIVPLPMPRPDYERSFSSAQSRREFEDLLRQAECWFEVARAGGGNVTGVEQDVQLDTFLAVQCDVLIALWKGLTSDRLTGTVRVVRFMLEGCPHARAARGLLDTLDRSLVYHVVGGAPCEARRLYPRDDGTGHEMVAASHRLLEGKDRFNADVRRLGPKLRKDVGVSLAALLAQRGEDRMRHVWERLAGYYASADVMALHFQRKGRRALIGLFGLVLVGFGCYQAYSNLLGEVAWRFWFALGYPVLLIVAIVGYRMVRQRQYHDKHLDYRALAEGLRVQFFWGMSGLRDAVPEHYLRRFTEDLGWIRNAIRTADLTTGAGASVRDDPSHLPARLRWVADHWVNDQQRYFTGAAAKNASGLARAGRITVAFYLGSIATMLCVPLLDFRGGFPAVVRGSMLLGTALALALSGAIQGYADKMALLEQAQHCRHMAALFTRASRRLDALLSRHDVAGAQELIRELGKEVLAENAEWLLMHRSRPMEVPKAA